MKLSRQRQFRVLGCDEVEDGENNSAIEDNVGRRCVLFLKNISGPLKLFLLRKSVCLLYTPTEEHFGIVRHASSAFNLQSDSVSP